MEENGNENWVCVASAGDVDEEDVLQVEANGKMIALFLVDGKYYATDDLCTHEKACLSDGYVDGPTVECPLHQGVFCIKTGKALHPPVEVDVKVYATKTDGSSIYIDLNPR